ncbi:MarR family transcriptional regulator [Sphingobium sp. MK2]|uniref:MarR family winged helix-turn-helix transcriptional regulator n=1 Tax=Sphingobium sp. MK2 TaxID=3116540 RepID=UPI0032E363C1
MPETIRQPRTMYLIWRVSEAILNLTERQRQEGVLSLSKYVVLSFLRDRDDLTSADVARRMGHTPQSTNETITSLEQAGLLEKRTRPSNRKAKFLSITPLGVDMLNLTETAMDRVEQQAFACLDDTGLAEFRATLQDVIKASKETLAHISDP